MPNSHHFNETEMWYLLYGLISSASIFRALETKVGDIRPSTIFINECGQIRVANLCSWPNEKTNYEKFIFDQELTYLSPEEVEDSKQGKTNQSRDKYLCEAFTIGVTILEAGLLRGSEDLYDAKKKIFNADELKRRIRAWL